MSGSREEQLNDLHDAYPQFVDCVRVLPRERFLGSLGDWTPRDIVAHFIGWNRITLVGSAQLREGVVPFYFHDGSNDYREVNAGFLRRHPSNDVENTLANLAGTMDALVSYLRTVPAAEWEADRGVVH